MNRDTLKDKYLIFSIGDEAYGIEIKYVLEIIGIKTIKRVPGLPPFIKGIINLKSNIIPVIDVRERFKKEEKEYDSRTCIVVISIKDEAIGFVVDRVLKVTNILEEEIGIPPEFKSIYKNRYIKGMSDSGEVVKLIIDCERFINYEGRQVGKVFKKL